MSEVDAVADKFSTPTYTLDIAAVLGGILDGWSLRAPAPDGVARLHGILHFANAGHCNWQEYAQWALDCCHDAGVPLKTKTVGARKLREMVQLDRAPSCLFCAFHREIHEIDRHITSHLAGSRL